MVFPVCLACLTMSICSCSLFWVRFWSSLAQPSRLANLEVPSCVWAKRGTCGEWVNQQGPWTQPEHQCSQPQSQASPSSAAPCWSGGCCDPRRCPRAPQKSASCLWVGEGMRAMEGEREREKRKAKRTFKTTEMQSRFKNKLGRRLWLLTISYHTYILPICSNICIDREIHWPADITDSQTDRLTCVHRPRLSSVGREGWTAEQKWWLSRRRSSCGYDTPGSTGMM